MSSRFDTHANNPLATAFEQGPKYAGAIILYIVVLTGLWHLAVDAFAIPRFLVPKPYAVFMSLYTLPAYYAKHLWTTFLEAGVGLLIGSVGGLSLGIFFRYGGWLARVMNPIVVASQVFPKEALAPLFIVAFGFGIFPKVVISALICFFPILVNTHKGLMATPSDYERLMHVMGISEWQKFWHFRLPFALGYILAALKVCATLSVIGAVVGEFVGASSGLGHVIRAANADIGTERIFAALLLLGVLGAGFYSFALLLEKVVLKKFPGIT